MMQFWCLFVVEGVRLAVPDHQPRTNDVRDTVSLLKIFRVTRFRGIADCIEKTIETEIFGRSWCAEVETKRAVKGVRAAQKGCRCKEELAKGEEGHRVITDRQSWCDGGGNFGSPVQERFFIRRFLVEGCRWKTEC
jgi:hypothetical protein